MKNNKNRFYGLKREKSLNISLVNAFYEFSPLENITLEQRLGLGKNNLAVAVHKRRAKRACATTTLP